MSQVCPSCGSSCPDSQSFCPNCGAKMPASPAGQQNPPGWQSLPTWQQPTGNYQNQPHYGQNPQNPYGQNPPYGQSPQNPQVPPSNPNPYGQPAYGMGPGQQMAWFKFIIYFQLFASAVISLITGFMVLTGAHYGSDGEAEFVYALFPGMSPVDKVYGVVLIALAVFAIVIRMQLAKFQAKGPKNYMAFLLANAVLSLVYVIAAAIALGEFAGELDYSTYIVQTIWSAVLLIANYTYFKKRAGLFVN